MLTKILKVSVFVNATLIRQDGQKGMQFTRKRSSPVEVVIKTAEGVIVCDQPKLSAAVSRGAVGPNVAEDVLVSATFDVRCLKQDNI